MCSGFEMQQYMKSKTSTYSSNDQPLFWLKHFTHPFPNLYSGLK